MKTIQYRVVDHFDVWGNPRDGWEVNNSAEIGIITLPEKHTNKDIIQALKEIGYLKKTCRTNQFHFIEMVSAVSIEAKSEGYRPLCTLYVVE